MNDYEAGRGIPNQAIIGKMERALGKFILNSCVSFITNVKSSLRSQIGYIGCLLKRHNTNPITDNI